MTPNRDSPRSVSPWLIATGLALAVAAAYAPAVRGGFVWDDDAHVIRAGLRSLAGLGRIWWQPGATQQFYPALYSAFWLEHRLWGDAPLGYHLANLALHAGAAFLFYRCLARLRVPGALLAAALFALHPVAVESVAWISEQKNTLSAVFFFGAALAWLHPASEHRRGLRLLAFGLFLLALLSKTVTATLPAALLVVQWWRRGRLSWREDLRPLLPWFAAGAGAGAITVWMERTVVGARGTSYHLGFLERLLLAGRAVWFYLGKLVFPVRLTFIYPRWNAASPGWAEAGGLLALAGLLAAAWALRRRSRAPLAFVLLYVGLLFPALGFVDVYPFIYSYVADHFQYLAIGVVAAAAAALAASGAARLPSPGRRAAAGAALLLLGGLGTLTWRQCRMYANAETLWRETIARNPSCWMAYNILGGELLRQGRTGEALADIEHSLRIEPDNAAAHANLGDAYRQAGRAADALPQYREALSLDPDNLVAHNNFGCALASLGRPEEAEAEFQAALRVRPDYALARANLAGSLLQRGKPAEAAAEFHRSLADDPDSAEARSNDGVALLQLNRRPEAIAEFRRALALEPAFLPAAVNLGDALLEAGDAAAAADCLQAALARSPDSFTLHHNLALALLQLGRRGEALDHFRRALALDSAQAAGSPGYLWLRLGQDDEALARFRAEIPAPTAPARP